MTGGSETRSPTPGTPTLGTPVSGTSSSFRLACVQMNSGNEIAPNVEIAAGRQTYGHSLIVDPWGEIVAEAGEEPGSIIADIDPARVAEARRAVPFLTNGRPYRPADDVKWAAE